MVSSELANLIYCSCCRGSTDGWKFLLVGGAAAVYSPQGMGLEDLWKISRVNPEAAVDGRSFASISRVDPEAVEPVVVVVVVVVVFFAGAQRV